MTPEERAKLRARAEANLAVPHLAEQERVTLALLDAIDTAESRMRGRPHFAVADFIDDHARRIANQAGVDWDMLMHEERDEWASAVHDVLNHLIATEDGDVHDGRNPIARELTRRRQGIDRAPSPDSEERCPTCDRKVTLPMDVAYARPAGNVIAIMQADARRRELEVQYECCLARGSHECTAAAMNWRHYARKYQSHLQAANNHRRELLDRIAELEAKAKS